MNDEQRLLKGIESLIRHYPGSIESEQMMKLLFALRKIREKYPDARIGESLSENMIRSKVKLREMILEHCTHDYYEPAQLGTVFVVGGWYGLMSWLLLSNSKAIEVDRIRSIDIDPSCEAVADWMCFESAEYSSRFKAVTADAMILNYDDKDRFHPDHWYVWDEPLNGYHPDLVINTSCEHMDATAWVDRIRENGKTLIAAQSNDYFEHPEHTNCARDIEHFKEQLNLDEIVGESVQNFDQYNRFSLLGYVY